MSRGFLILAVWFLNINPVFLLLLSVSGSRKIKGESENEEEVDGKTEN